MHNPTETPMRHGKESEGIDLLKALRMVRSAGGALAVQIGLYGQLANIEWKEEKNRLRKVLLMTLLGFSSTLSLMLFTGILVLALSWETIYRIPAAISMLLLYGLGIGVACYHLKALSRLNRNSFSALREELSIDAALIRSRL